MRLPRLLSVAAAVALAAGTAGSGTALSETNPADKPTKKYPVPYSLLAPAGAAGLNNLSAAPPGANDWACKPSKAHPNPVVLVHGLSANMALNWQTVSPLLANEGYCVFALTYGTQAGLPYPVNQIGGLQPMEKSARQLKTFIGKVLTVTRAKKVDIVGHSEGSLMPNYYVKFLGGAKKVDRYVGMTPLWKGTQLLGLDFLNRQGQVLGLDPVLVQTLDRGCGSCRQFLHGSEFLRNMSKGGAAVPGVTYTMLMTNHDELVIPYTSGYLKGRGVTNIVVQDKCKDDHSEHGNMAASPTNAQLVLNALDPAHAKPVKCTFVPPIT